MSTVNVIVPCGSRKQTQACTAGTMYTGPYHRACLAYARSRTDDAHIFILSAKYGFVKLDRIIEPYEKHMSENMGKAGDDFWLDVELQAALLFPPGALLVLLGGYDYTCNLQRICEGYGWPVEVPLRGAWWHGQTNTVAAGKRHCPRGQFAKSSNAIRQSSIDCPRGQLKPCSILIPAGSTIRECQCGARVVDLPDGKNTAHVECAGEHFPQFGEVHICNVKREQLFAVERDTSGLPQLTAAELVEAKRHLSRRFNHKIACVRPLGYRFKLGRECEFCGAGCSLRIAILCDELVYEVDVCRRHKGYDGMSMGRWPRK